MRRHNLLLRLYPKSFRDEYGAEMRRVFARQHRDAGNWMARTVLWAREIADTAGNAMRVHADILGQDLRCSWRACRRAPGFFAAAVGVTALGIGVTTAAFTLTDHVLLRPLPFPDADRVVKIWQGARQRSPALRGLQGTNDVSPANYRDWKAQSSSFIHMGAYAIVSSNLVASGEPERLAGANVTADAMRAVGVAPARGRTLDDADDRAGAACVVLIGDAFWRRKFDADPSVLGRKIVLDDEPCAVAGIMPRGFDFPVRDTAFWRPIRFAPDSFEDRNDTYLRVIARLEPGLSREQASADLALVSARLAEIHPRDNADLGAVIIALRDEVNDQSRTLIYALAGASACVLLIACTNLVSLFLARATARGRELAVRSALGAGSERLIRQLLTDTLLIAIAGGSLGVVFAVLSVPIGARLVPTALPIAEAPTADARMLLIAAAVTLITVMACGVLPAIRASRHASAGAMRDGVRAGTSRGTERLRGALVAAQVAASVALLVCAGLLLRALWRVEAIDPGFQPEGVLAMRLNLPWPQYAPNEARVQFYRRILGDVKALPNVDSTAFASYLPMTLRGGVWGVFLPGRAQDPGNESLSALARFITPDYFRVMRIPLVQGRAFDNRDTLKGEQSIIVSATFGDAIWPGEPVLGRHVVVMRTERTIVGVVGEVKVRGLERRNEPQMYFPHEQQASNNFINYAPRDLAVRTVSELDGSGAGALAAAIREIVVRADPRLPVSDVRPLTAIVASDTAARSVQARVLGAFAAVACLLAGVGLYGLLAFTVSVRTREIGVRMALGADRRTILGMVLGRGLKLACVGASIGLVAAYLAGRSFSAVLAGIEPADVTTLAAAMGVAVAMTLVGSLLPAVKAARVNPMEATRAE